MTSANGHTRTCPTRTDGRAALFAHKVTVPQCLERQRASYHKCFTCVHNTARTAALGPFLERTRIVPAPPLPAIAPAPAQPDADEDATGGVPSEAPAPGVERLSPAEEEVPTGAELVEEPAQEASPVLDPSELPAGDAPIVALPVRVIAS